MDKELKFHFEKTMTQTNQPNSIVNNVNLIILIYFI